MYEHPARLTNEEGLERSRLTVFFRLLLGLPHIIWFSFWSIGVFFVAIFNWFATLFRGRPPLFCHNFITAFIRYSAHLAAYLSLTVPTLALTLGSPLGRTVLIPAAVVLELAGIVLSRRAVADVVR